LLKWDPSLDVLVIVKDYKSFQLVKINNAEYHIDISFTIYDAILTDLLHLCKIILDEGVIGRDQTKS